MSLTMKQKNYKEYLISNEYSVYFSEDNKKIIFGCKYDTTHINELTLTSFGNAKCKFTNPKDMCKFCRKNDDNEKIIKEFQLQTKHKIIGYVDKAKVTFKCFYCDTEHVSSKRTLMSNLNCVSCSAHGKKDYDTLIKEVEEFSFKLITKKDEYKSNKDILVLCPCNNEWKCSLADLKRGRKCLKCKTERTYETNNIVYGCDNVFQNEVIKKKSRETCLKNHGVEYAQQSSKVREKTTITCLEKYGYVRSFCKPEVYEKIKEGFFKKYGVEYPLQSSIIQEKIDKTFIKLCGKNRPIGTEYHSQIILEKYGNTIYVCTDHFKQTMIEKYGVEHALQNDEIFRKMIQSSFRKREYIYNDDTKTYILGYEDLALKDIENSGLYKIIEAGDSENIPTFWYDFENKKHKYYPDIFLPEINTIIEVKSDYYFENEMGKNIAKAIEVSKTYTILFYVYFNRTSKKCVYELKDNIFEIKEEVDL